MPRFVFKDVECNFFYEFFLCRLKKTALKSCTVLDLQLTLGPVIAESHSWHSRSHMACVCDNVPGACWVTGLPQERCQAHVTLAGVTGQASVTNYTMRSYLKRGCCFVVILFVLQQDQVGLDFFCFRNEW